MKNEKRVIRLIQKVFRAYSKSFDNSLNRLKVWPWTEEKTVIHESNQVHRFLDAYQKTGRGIVTWMELPVYLNGGESKNEKPAHIDAFILDHNRKLLFFIEAKRFSKPDQAEDLQSDVGRLFNDVAKRIYAVDKDQISQHITERINRDYDAYMIALADIWDYRGRWCEEYASKWEEWVNSNYGNTIIPLVESINNPKPKEDEEGLYHLLCALMPVYDADKKKVFDYVEGVPFPKSIE